MREVTRAADRLQVRERRGTLLRRKDQVRSTHLGIAPTSEWPALVPSADRNTNPDDCCGYNQAIGTRRQLAHRSFAKARLEISRMSTPLSASERFLFGGGSATCGYAVLKAAVTASTERWCRSGTGGSFIAASVAATRSCKEWIISRMALSY
jgi:hypothetical protein